MLYVGREIEWAPGSRRYPVWRPKVTPLRLFHFTCDHSYPRIGHRGWLFAQVRPTLFGVPLPDLRVVWLTSGDFESTGMDRSEFTTCDRSAYRYIVTDTSTCEPWLDSEVRRRFPDAADLLERVGDPARWWVSSEPVPVRLG